MKIGIFGDIHLRNKAPQGRVDDWLATQSRKFQKALDWMRMQDCKLILQPGDLFDSPRPSNYVLQRVIGRLRQYELGMSFYSVLGQHDCYYHDVEKSERTPMGVIAASGLLHILGTKPHGSVDAQIYGASWGQEPPKLRRRVTGENLRILVAHAPVGDKPLWPGHKLPSPTKYVQDHPGFDLIVLGDYHYRFCTKVDNTTIVNMGCLMRMQNSKHDRGHKPHVGLFDTESGEVEFYALDFQPANDVFRPMTVSEVGNPPEVLEEFLAKLRDHGGLDIDFLDNLERVVREKRTPRRVRKVLGTILEAMGIKSTDE